MKTLLNHKEWKEFEKILAKFQIGYTVNYDMYKDVMTAKAVQINPIDIVGSEEKGGKV